MEQQTTYAEDLVLQFLMDNAGREFSNVEIQEATGVHAVYVDKIMENLAWKGCKVKTDNKRGLHRYTENTWLSYAVFALLGVIIATIFLFASMDYLDDEPAYDVEYHIMNGEN